MNITVIAAIVAVIEIVSIVVKNFFPKFTKWLPLANGVIGIVASLITGTDVLAGLATSGITIMSYDFFHQLYKMIKGEDNKKLEEKHE